MDWATKWLIAWTLTFLTLVIHAQDPPTPITDLEIKQIIYTTSNTTLLINIEYSGTYDENYSYELTIKSDDATEINIGVPTDESLKNLEYTKDMKNFFDKEVTIILSLHYKGDESKTRIATALIMMKDVSNWAASVLTIPENTQNYLRVWLDFSGDEEVLLCRYGEDFSRCHEISKNETSYVTDWGIDTETGVKYYACISINPGEIPYCGTGPQDISSLTLGGDTPVVLTSVRIVYPETLNDPTTSGNIVVDPAAKDTNLYDIVSISGTEKTYTTCIGVTNTCEGNPLPVHQIITHDVFVVQYADGNPETITASSIIHTVEDYKLDGTKIDNIFEMRWEDNHKHGEFKTTLTGEDGSPLNPGDAEFTEAIVHCDPEHQCFAYFFLLNTTGERVIVKPNKDELIGEVMSAKYPSTPEVKDVTTGPSIRHITASWGSDGRSATVTTCLHHDPGRNASTHDLVLLDEAGRARRVSMDAPHLHDLCFPPVLLEEGGFAVGGEVRVLVLRRGGGGHVEAAHHVKTFLNRPETERVGDEATRLCWTNLSNEPSILNHPASSLNHQPTSLNCNHCCVNVKDDEKRTVQVSSMVAPEVWLTTVYQVRVLSVTVTGIEIVKRAGDIFAVDDQFSVTYDGVTPGEAVQSVHLTVIGKTTGIEEVDYLSDPAGTATLATFSINQPMLDLTGPVTWMIKITTTKTSFYGEISFNMPDEDMLNEFPKCDEYEMVEASKLLRTKCTVQPTKDDDIVTNPPSTIIRTSNEIEGVTYRLYGDDFGSTVQLCRPLKESVVNENPSELSLCTQPATIVPTTPVNIINSASLDYETGFTVGLEGKELSELVIYSVEGNDMKYCTGATCKKDIFTKSTQTYNIVAVHVEGEAKSSSQTQLTDMNIELQPVTDTILEYSFTHLPDKNVNQAKAISTTMNAENEKTVKITCTSDECFGYFLELGADKYKVSIKYYESDNSSNMNEVVSETFDFQSPSKGSGHEPTVEWLTMDHGLGCWYLPGDLPCHQSSLPFHQSSLPGHQSSLPFHQSSLPGHQSSLPGHHCCLYFAKGNVPGQQLMHAAANNSSLLDLDSYNKEARMAESIMLQKVTRVPDDGVGVRLDVTVLNNNTHIIDIDNVVFAFSEDIDTHGKQTTFVEEVTETIPANGEKVYSFRLPFNKWEYGEHVDLLLVLHHANTPTAFGHVQAALKEINANVDWIGQNKALIRVYYDQTVLCSLSIDGVQCPGPVCFKLEPPPTANPELCIQPSGTSPTFKQCDQTKTINNPTEMGNDLQEVELREYINEERKMNINITVNDNTEIEVVLYTDESSGTTQPNFTCTVHGSLCSQTVINTQREFQVAIVAVNADSTVKASTVNGFEDVNTRVQLLDVDWLSVDWSGINLQSYLVENVRQLTNEIDSHTQACNGGCHAFFFSFAKEEYAASVKNLELYPKTKVTREYNVADLIKSIN